MKRRIVKQSNKKSKVSKKKLKKAVKSVKDFEFEPLGDIVIKWDTVLSTGSTLLDLAISGGRVETGGIPAGILVEIYGRSGSGKTSILSELCASAQVKGGDALFLDPEARLDAEYARTYGVTIKEENYKQPNTVTEMFGHFDKWNPKTKNSKSISIIAADSLAALSTELELDKGDKMGMRRAKEFSQELRKHARKINEKRWVLACSNQVRQGDYGDVTPGGKAVEFYSSLRISVNKVGLLEKTRKYRYTEGYETKTGADIKRVYGICSKCVVTKSSIDKPFREVPIYIVFDYGIDDVRGNLQWLKDVHKLTKYKAVDKEYQRMDLAIKYIEDNSLENELKQEVIDTWQTIEKMFQEKRKKKQRK